MSEVATYSRKQVYELLAQMSGQKNTISCPRLFIDLLAGNFGAALLLNQIIYWSDHTKDPDGWFYKPYEEWQEEIGLSQAQVKLAIDGDDNLKKKRKTPKPKLSEFGVHVELRKAPNNKAGQAVPTLHYRIDKDEFIKAVMGHFGYEDSLYPGYQETQQPGYEVSLQPYGYEENQQPYITENTTESTSKPSENTEDARALEIQDGSDQTYEQREIIVNALSDALKVSTAIRKNIDRLSENARVWLKEGYSAETILLCLSRHAERWQWKADKGQMVNPPTFEQLLGYAMEVKESATAKPLAYDPNCEHGCNAGYIDTFEADGTAVRTDCACRVKLKEKVG